MSERSGHAIDLLPLQVSSGPESYASILAELADVGAGDRVSATTMSYCARDPTATLIMKGLERASDRGAVVTLGIDAYTLMLRNGYPLPGPMLAPLPFGQDEFEHRRANVAKLDDYTSTNARFINVPSHPYANPVAGRSHLKYMVIRDMVYVLTANLDKMDDTDMTVSFQDPETADWLHAFTTDIVQARSVSDCLEGQDQVREVGPDTSVLVDAGVPGQSVIMDEALRIVEEADEWVVLASQYYPRGKMMQALASSSMHGVQVLLPYNDPAVHGFPSSYAERRAIRRTPGLPPTMQPIQLPPKGPKSHLKVVASEKEGLAGNNNFDPRGVRLGTAELSVHRKDPKFARNLADFTLGLCGQPLLDRARPI